MSELSLYSYTMPYANCLLPVSGRQILSNPPKSCVFIISTETKNVLHRTIMDSFLFSYILNF